MGNYVMPAITIIFFTLIIGAIGYVIFGSRHQGAWDDEAKVSAVMRKRGWKVRPKVDEVTSFLLGSDTPGEMWPIEAGETGVQGIVHAPWKAVTVQGLHGDKLYVTLELAQRSDGAVANLSEAIVERELEGFEVRTAGASIPNYLTADVRSSISSWNELEALYLNGEHLTAVFETQYGEADIVERVDAYSRRLISIAHELPASLWE
ncbi:hypothetical protein [Arcanobacterium haemolyticum]